MYQKATKRNNYTVEVGSSNYGQIEKFLSIPDTRSMETLHIALVTPLIPTLSSTPPLRNSFIIRVDKSVATTVVPITDITRKIV